MVKTYEGLENVPTVAYTSSQLAAFVDRMNVQQHAALAAKAQLLQDRVATRGTVRDYAYAIVEYLEALWSTRRNAPEIFEEMERYFWLGLKLLEQHANELQEGQQAGKSLSGWPFWQMQLVYEREGYIQEAVMVLEWAEWFGKLFNVRPAEPEQVAEPHFVRERLAALQGELHAR